MKWMGKASGHFVFFFLVVVNGLVFDIGLLPVNLEFRVHQGLPTMEDFHQAILGVNPALLHMLDVQGQVLLRPEHQAFATSGKFVLLVADKSETLDGSASAIFQGDRGGPGLAAHLLLPIGQRECTHPGFWLRV